MSVLALDVGNKRVGIAYEIQGISFPYKVITRVELVKELKKLIQERGVTRIIVGIPLINSGLSSQALKIRLFSEKLQQIFPQITFSEIDERFTTIIPRKDEDKNKKDEKVDALSAQMILESYLSIQKNTLSS